MTIVVSFGALELEAAQPTLESSTGQMELWYLLIGMRRLNAGTMGFSPREECDMLKLNTSISWKRHIAAVVYSRHLGRAWKV